MQKNMEVRDPASSGSVKKASRCRSFHFRYLELCRSKNLTPLSDIRVKNNNNTPFLDFFGDKLNVTDWLLVMESLFYDQVLQNLCMRLRKNIGTVLEHMDTEKKARLFRQKPVIYTKFIFSGVVEAVANCIEFNKNLKILCLEGLPLSDKYVESIAKALSFNDSIREISFERSIIQDKGCEAICNTMKYMENVVKLNLCECNLSTKGAACIAEMLKIQKISRYTEGWQKSLRYRDVDPDRMPGLRSIALSRNPHIGDDGLKHIVEILKEDVWLKVIEMENCGLTDRAANIILDCLEVNNYIVNFNVKNNPGISVFLMRSIREHLGKDEDEQKFGDDHQLIERMPNSKAVHNRKPTVTQLKELLKTMEEQLNFERVLRKKAERLNEKLNQQILAYENQMEEQANAHVPEGFVVVKNESLQSIINERNEFEKIAMAATKAASNSSAGGNVINRFKHQNNLMPSQRQYTKRHDDPEPPLEQLHTQLGLEASAEYSDSPETSPCHTPMPSGRASVHKVRKVKSEVKYVEAPPKSGTKKNESKSDHEYANETDYDLKTVRFETNIGDSIQINSYMNMANQMSLQKNYPDMGGDLPTVRSEKRNSGYPKTMINNKIEIDELNLSTARSSYSEENCTDSETLRNSVDFQPLKVFIRPNPKVPLPMQPEAKVPVGARSKSPRSLFLGLCDE